MLSTLYGEFYIPPTIPPPPEELVGPVVSDSWVPIWAWSPDSPTETRDDNLDFRFDEYAVQFHEPLDTTNGTHSVTNESNWQLLRNGSDASQLIQSVSVESKYIDGRSRYLGTESYYAIKFRSELDPASYRLIARDTIHGVDDRPINGDKDLVAGGNAVFDFQISPYQARTEKGGIRTSSHDLEIASAAAGSYVAAWVDSEGAGMAQRVVVQRYDASGAPVGSYIVVAPEVESRSYHSVHVSVTDDGRFAVGWQSTTMNVVTGTGSPTWINLQRFAASGKPLGETLSGPAYSTIQDLALAEDGSLVLIYGKSGHSHLIPAEQQDPERGPAVYFLRYDANGTALAEAIRLGLGSEGQVAIASDGRYVVVWTDGTQPSRGILAQTYHADGTSFSSQVQVSFRSGKSMSPRVALDPHGNAVITWMNLRGDKRTIVGQRIAFSGKFLGAEFEVSQPDDKVIAGPSLAMGNSGDFFIGWTVESEVFSPVRVQGFDPTATPRGPALVPGDGNATLQRPQLAVGQFNDVIVNWAESRRIGFTALGDGQRVTGYIDQLSRPTQHFDVLNWRLAVDLNGDRAGVDYFGVYVPRGEPLPIVDPDALNLWIDSLSEFSALTVEIVDFSAGDLLTYADPDPWSTYSWREGPQRLEFYRGGDIDPIEGLLSTRFSTTAKRASGRQVQIKVTAADGSDYETLYSTPAYATISIQDSSDSEVAGRHIFYNDSAFDGNDPAANAADDAAIAADKSALLPGQTATFANVTSYSAGITGLMVDLTGVHGVLDANDFVFRIGTSSDTTHWAYAPEPKLIKVRHNQGTAGSDRVEIIWDRGTIQNVWLQVTVLANGNTGLAEPDVFYLGNRIGDTGNEANRAQPQTIEALALINRLIAGGGGQTAAQGDPDDFNRDGRITTADLLVVFNAILSQGAPLEMISAADASLLWEPQQSLAIELTSSPAAPLAAVFAAWGDEDARELRLPLVGAGLLMEEPDEN